MSKYKERVWAKLKDYEESYWDYKDYIRRWKDSPEPSIVSKVRTNHAPFEDQAISNAEFDLAMRNCGDYDLYYKLFICREKLESYARKYGEDVNDLDIRAQQARLNVFKILCTKEWV